MSRPTYYATREGKKVRVPSVTTICGLLDKPALKRWLQLQAIKACREADNLDGMSDGELLVAADAVAEDARNVGHECHAVISARLSGQEVLVADRDLYNCVDAFFSQHTVEPLEVGPESIPAMELELVSQRHLYGGTMDFYGLVDGEIVLVDWKTSRNAAVWPESFLQTAGYELALVEQYREQPSARLIVSFRRSGESEPDAPMFRIERRVGPEDGAAFLALRSIYEWKKGAK